MPTALVLALALSGCLAQESTVKGPEGTAGIQAVDIYEYRWPGDAQAPAGQEVGWAMRLVNPTDHVIELRVESTAQRYGPVGLQGWASGPDAVEQRLAPGRPALWLFSADVEQGGSTLETTLHYRQSGVDVGRTVLVRNLSAVAGDAVEPGMHVETATVGLWFNGTSFYTNILALHQDPSFPAGYDRAKFNGTPLPVYVYGEERSEQPPRSKDTCHITTISGYNALLKEQEAGSTGVRFLVPEEAYTRAGNEDHALYGDALIFVNSVVAIEGTTGPEDDVPDPTAPCFDLANHAPVPPVRTPWRLHER